MEKKPEVAKALLIFVLHERTRLKYLTWWNGDRSVRRSERAIG